MEGKTSQKKNSKRIVIGASIGICILFLVCIIGIVLIGFMPISHTSLKKKAHDLFLKAAIDSCSIGSVSLTLFKGFSFKDLTLSKNIDKDKSVLLVLPKVTVGYHIFPVITHWSICKKILHNRVNKIFYVTSAQKNNGVYNMDEFKENLLRSLYDEISGPDTIIFECINSIQIDKGNIRIDSVYKPIIHLENTRLTLQPERHKPRNITIKTDIEKLTGSTIHFTDFQSIIHIKEYNAKVVIKNSSIFNGTLKASFDLDLLHNYINTGKIDIDAVDIEKVYSLFKNTKGNVTGVASVHITLDSCKAAIQLLSGIGTVQSNHVRAKDLPILNQIAKTTMLPGLSNLTFEKINGDFTINKGKIQSENLKGHGDPLSIDLSGWVKPDSGTYSINFKGIFEPYYKDSISTVVWETLYPENDGRRFFRCTIYGTIDSPKISIEKNLAERAINSILKTLGDELKSLFKP